MRGSSGSRRDARRSAATFRTSADLTFSGLRFVFGHGGCRSVPTARTLVAVEDVLVGESLGALIAIEDLGDPPRRVRRVLLYRVQDGKLRECWLFDEDQRFIDELWSTES